MLLADPSLQNIQQGSFAMRQRPAAQPDAIRIVSWNINRGQQFADVVDFLSRIDGDLILLQEVDLNARRTDYRNVAKDLAQVLRMHYVFGCEFQELSKSNHRGPAFHGQATLSRFPLLGSRILRFASQSDFWRPHWFIPSWQPFQRRIGGRMALVSHIDTGESTLACYNLHLESRGKRQLRFHQLSEVFDDLREHPAHSGVVVGGDFNSDVSQRKPALLVKEMQFNNAFEALQHLSTCDSGVRRRRIDWILSGGGISIRDGVVHTDVTASDHYPLSAVICRGCADRQI